MADKAAATPPKAKRGSKFVMRDVVAARIAKRKPFLRSEWAKTKKARHEAGLCLVRRRGGSTSTAKDQNESEPGTRTRTTLEAGVPPLKSPRATALMSRVSAAWLWVREPGTMPSAVTAAVG